MKVVLKEIRETRINLMIIITKPVIMNEKVLVVLNEANQLMAVFLTSIAMAKTNNQFRK